MSDGSSDAQSADLTTAGGSIELDRSLNVRGHWILSLQHEWKIAVGGQRNGPGEYLGARVVTNDDGDDRRLGRRIIYGDAGSCPLGVVESNDVAAGVAA